MVATAIPVCFRWLGFHNRILQLRGYQRVATYSDLGDGRPGDVRRAANSSVGIAGNRSTLTAFVLGADTPALLRKGALRALGWQPDLSRDISSLFR